MVTPTLASTTQAGYNTGSISKNLDTVTIEFIDCTGIVPVQKEITLLRTEWNEILVELRSIPNSKTSMRDVFSTQLTILQKHNLVSQESNINTLMEKFNRKTHSPVLKSLQERVPRNLPINNSIFSALSAISFTLENENGSTFVFGLNTFINYIGFDIVSVHKGYATTGIQTNGLISKSVPPGEYAGFIFGFFGYWYGEKVSTGVYSTLTVAGLAIITGWVPVP